MGAAKKPKRKGAGRRRDRGRSKHFKTSILKQQREIKELRRKVEEDREKAAAEKTAKLEALRKEALNRDFQYSGKSNESGEMGSFELAKTGLIVVSSAVAFALVLMVLIREDRTAKPIARRPTPRVRRPDNPTNSPRAPVSDFSKGEGDVDDPSESPERIKPVVLDGDEGSGNLLSDELIGKSAFHKNLADLMADFDRLRNQGSSSDPFSDYRERLQAEEQLLEQIRGLGPAALNAMIDVLDATAGHPFQLFLARALSGMGGPEALAATEKLLAKSGDYGVRIQLVKSMARSPESIESIGRVLTKINDANLRVMILREYAHRTRSDEDAAPETVKLFRQLALNDPNPTVRAEAIAVIGRRKLSGEREILEQIVRKESHATVRQRAIVSLARTAGEESLPALRGVLEGKAEEGVRASTVLALTLIGPKALPALEEVARDDESEEIRNRAKRAIKSIRFSLENQPNSGGAAPPPFSGSN